MLKGLRGAVAVENPAYLGEWPFRIGQFIMNFGNIELISYQYLSWMEPSRLEFNRQLGNTFSVRVRRIKTLIQDPAIKFSANEILNRWDEALELGKWRNRIAHNPILPTWKPGSDPETMPPDVLGIPDMKELSRGDESTSLSIEALKSLNSEAVRIAKSLNGMALLWLNSRS